APRTRLRARARARYCRRRRPEGRRRRPSHSRCPSPRCRGGRRAHRAPRGWPSWSAACRAAARRDDPAGRGATAGRTPSAPAGKVACPSCRPPLGRLLLAAGRRPLLGSCTQTLLERRHEVDGLVVVLGRLRWLDRLALALLLDQGAQRVLVAVIELAGVDLARLLLDDLLGDLQHLRIRLGQFGTADVLEAAHLLGGTQRGEH